jgi:Regulator of chromosome condensation (RCC1) repeat
MAGVGALLAALAVAGMAQLTPTSISVSPTNPIISATQTQQFTALSGNTIDLQGVIQVASGPGADHTCALLANGTVECWGYNDEGQLGNGTVTASNVPVAVNGLSGQVTAMAVGGAFSCALLSGGTVECWGGNYDGELGNSTNLGTFNANPLPSPVSGLSGAVTAISADDMDSWAITPTTIPARRSG